MPKIDSIKKTLVLGSGPIIIGQAAQFDYSGTQACEALKEEGVEVVLINSNPATIMTDKEVAHKIYIEPLTIDRHTMFIKTDKAMIITVLIIKLIGVLLNLTNIFPKNKATNSMAIT